jgi:hypothetical protein
MDKRPKLNKGKRNLEAWDSCRGKVVESMSERVEKPNRRAGQLQGTRDKGQLIEGHKREQIIKCNAVG